MNTLTDEHFFLEDSPAGPTMKLNARGNVMVLFTSLNCPSCTHFEPVFHNEILPALVPQGWIFAQYVVENNPQRQAIANSTRTRTPLTRSPSTIIYSNGVPIGMKTGAADGQTMIGFATTLLESYKAQMSRPAPQRQPPPQRQAPQQQHSHGAPPPQRQAASQPPPKPVQSSRIKYSSSGVAIIDGFYGLPYNMNTDQEFIDYNDAYVKEAR